MGSRIKMSIMGLYNYDPTIFDGLAVPEQLDKDNLVRQILIELAELMVIYPDSDYMKMAITNWSNLRLHTWNRMAEVLYEDYDPFINIKRDEVRTIKQSRNLSDTTNTSVNAFETDVLQDQSSVTGTNTGTVTTEEHFHVEGDSAITDAQDVLKKELDVRIRYDMARIITDEFKERFCLLLY